MKNLHFLVYIYTTSIVLSFLGYWIDNDVPKGSLAFQMLEVFVFSIFLSGILIALYLLALLVFNSIRRLSR